MDRAYETPKANIIDSGKFIAWLITSTVGALFGRGLK